MSHDEVVAKATDLIAPVLGAEGCKKLVAAIFGLEKFAKVGELRPLLQKA